mgnify:CR=1 FL=1
MYKVIGYCFQTKEDGSIWKRPTPAYVTASSYEEAHKKLAQIGITHYMFILVPSKEVK